MNRIVFKYRVVLPADETDELRNRLHSLLDLATDEASRASVYYALRWVGDEQSVALIAGYPPLDHPWHDAANGAISEIRRRLRSQGTR